MKLASLLAIGCCLLASAAFAEDKKESPVYELRTYYAADGKFDAMNARFRDHTCKLFEKHGIKNIGYWVPLDNPEHKLIYLLEFPSRDAAKASWKAFIDDPAWKAAFAASEKDGKLVAKMESVYMQPTDYSPALKIENLGDRVFEMRTYTTTPNNLDDLDARFRDHTVKLFAKHGMTNVVYFHLLPDQKGQENTLLYFLAHKSQDAGKKSFDTFRADADWVAAKKASEEKAGGSLTTEGGVVSVYLKPVDYSPLK